MDGPGRGEAVIFASPERDLPDMEALEDAGLLSKNKLLAGDMPVARTDPDGSDDLADMGRFLGKGEILR